MTTGSELIGQIANCSSQIADLTKFITSHPTAPTVPAAEVMRIELEEQRETLRNDLQNCPDLSFS